ncbi:Bardet-Biedl syndrome 12 protein [Pleurodeles waltl]|uniref:Bardet-Biedl syndrome 12 protein n=1 Tax=Pleurodeles waltl TaxID=8319 RepID=UPI0037094CE6
MNTRRHIGLQQLSALATSGRTLLGPIKSQKFIIDESTLECSLTSSVFRLLENLDLTSAVGQLLNETVQIQNKTYGTGTSTLMFLVGAWSKAALECLSQGIPVSVVVSVMSEGLTSCIKEVKSMQIRLADILKPPGPKNMHSSDCTSKTPLMPFPRKNGFESVNSQQKVTCDSCKNKCISPPPTSDFKGNSGPTVLLDKSLCQIPKNCFTMKTVGHRVKLTHSRHFQTKEEQFCEEPKLSNFQGSASEFTDISCDWRGLEQLTEGLSHGYIHCMKLVRDAANHICNTSDDVIDALSADSVYTLSKIVLCSLPGLSEDHSGVYSGYVAVVSMEQASVAVNLHDKPLKVLVVEGDLTETYRHLGFHSSCVNTVTECSYTLGSGSEDLWTDSAFNQITQLNVNLILVTGTVSVNLMQNCTSANILVISHVSQNVLQAFCEATGAVSVTYFTQMSRCCVGAGACVSVLRTVNLKTVGLGRRMLINIKTSDIPLVTAVLTTPTVSKMQSIEDQFWTCARRLQNAIVDQNVFLGGGAVELLCLSHLRKLEEQCSKREGQNSTGQFHIASSWLATSSLFYKPCVLRAMAEGWYQYLSSVMCNTTKGASAMESRTCIQNYLNNLADCCSPFAYICAEIAKEQNSIFDLDYLCNPKGSRHVYDNVLAKEEAWRRALDLVLLVVQTDHEILTGSFTQTQLMNSNECQHL